MEPTEEILKQSEFADAEEDALTATTQATLSAQEALDRLRKGQTVQNVRIEKLAFKGEFTEPVRLKRVVLVSPRFEGATFQNEVLFAQCTLDRPLFARRNEFTHGLAINGSTLIRFQMAQATVKGVFNCDNIQVRGRFLVANCAFERVRFWEAQFRGWTEFKNCTFTEEADFRSFHAIEGFVMQRCQFKADVLLRGSSVGKKFDLGASRFEGLLDLSKSKLHDFAYLEGIEQGPNQRFAFLNAVGERILVQPEQLIGRLASEENKDYKTAMQEYAFLKRSYAGLHRHDQEDWAYYRFKVSQRRCCDRSWWRPWTKLGQFADWLLLDHGCGYCTNPMRAVRTAGLIILIFGLLYAAGLDSFYIDKVPFETSSRDSLANRTVLGLFTSVSVFTSGLSGIRDVAKGWMNLPLIVESLLGTLLWGLFIVAFGRKVIR